VTALAVGTVFFLGLRHSLEPDHMAALAHFASADPRPLRGLGFGLRWGAGHAAAVLILGVALVAFDLPSWRGFETAAEIAVGLTLIGLALWRIATLLYTRHEHAHQHANGVVHSHPHRHAFGHLHAHGPTLTGVVHGAAGAFGVLALLPSAHSAGSRVLLLLVFGLGSLASMGAFGLLAARLCDGRVRLRPGSLLDSGPDVNLR
jgi:sulfite exporter TauE/SafE